MAFSWNANSFFWYAVKYFDSKLNTRSKGDGRDRLGWSATFSQLFVDIDTVPSVALTRLLFIEVDMECVILFYIACACTTHHRHSCRAVVTSPLALPLSLSPTLIHSCVVISCNGSLPSCVSCLVGKKKHVCEGASYFRNHIATQGFRINISCEKIMFQWIVEMTSKVLNGRSEG